MAAPLSVHLVDGTYELFRQFYGRRRFEKGDPAPYGAVRGVLHSVLEMIENGATHVGVATDHVIESFRNDLWPGYKTGAGIDRALRAQFVPLEQAELRQQIRIDPRTGLVVRPQTVTKRFDDVIGRDADVGRTAIDHAEHRRHDTACRPHFPPFLVSRGWHGIEMPEELVGAVD